MASLSDRTNKQVENIRSQQYKNTGKGEELKRRRAEVSVTLRKEKRDAILSKKRNIISDDPDNVDNLYNTEELSDEALTIAEDELKDIAIEFRKPGLSGDKLFDLYQRIRRVLSQNSSAPVDFLIKLRLLPVLINGLQSDNKKIVYEAAWSITNVASGTSEHTKAVVEAGVIPILLQYLPEHRRHKEITEQCIWALANIVGDSQEYRDLAIKRGLFKYMANIMNDIKSLPITVVRNIAWLFSNVARHRNANIPEEIYGQSVRYIQNLLCYNDKSVKCDACWGLSYLIKDAKNEQLKYFANQIVMHNMLSFLGSGENSLILGALRVIGRFAQGTENYCDILIQSGIFRQVFPSIMTTKAYDTEILYNCIWVLSNVVAGPETHINEIVSCNLVPFIIKHLSSGISRIRIECSWFLSNFVNGCSRHQIKEIVKCGGVDAITKELKNDTNNDYICNLLECIFCILDTYSSCIPEKLESIKDSIEECGGVDVIEKFQLWDNEKISVLSNRMMEVFFQDDNNPCGGDYDSEDHERYPQLQRIEF
uniref:Importin subunit alpha n=1 Tax=Strongyloides papillosus TaxID=174720 RepID=A0A0N5BIX6_STREA